MNSETGFSSKLRRLTALLHVCVMIRGELAIGRGTSRHTLHMRVGPSRLALIDVARQFGQGSRIASSANVAETSSVA